MARLQSINIIWEGLMWTNFKIRKVNLVTIWPWTDKVKVKVPSEAYISVEVIKDICTLSLLITTYMALNWKR